MLTMLEAPDPFVYHAPDGVTGKLPEDVLGLSARDSSVLRYKLTSLYNRR